MFLICLIRFLYTDHKSKNTYSRSNISLKVDGYRPLEFLKLITDGKIYRAVISIRILPAIRFDG